jgi:TorA maturation chaperone TorD
MTPIQNQLILRQALYRFFGSLFLYPDQELLMSAMGGAQELLDSRALWEEYAFAEKLSALITFLLNFTADERKTIVDGYNRLFLVKPLAPPYETSYLKVPGQSEGTLAAEISGTYGQAGLIVSPETNELPDHIAVELEYMSFLCEKELTALQNDDADELASTLQEQQHFMDHHLARWYPQFAKKALSTGVESTLYQHVIGTAFAFLRSELELLEIKS